MVKILNKDGIIREREIDKRREKNVQIILLVIFAIIFVFWIGNLKDNPNVTYTPDDICAEYNC